MNRLKKLSLIALAIFSVTACRLEEPEDPMGGAGGGNDVDAGILIDGGMSDGGCDPDAGDVCDPCELMLCEDDELCVDGECVVQAECNNDDECGPNAGCVRGQCVGNQPQPAEEICGDGIDNNQDGVVDENCDPIAPECSDNTDCARGAACVDGECIGNRPPAAEEICGDGIDNNQNGMVDENCEPIECGGPAAGCDAGMVCVDGECEPAPPFACIDNEDCGPNAGCLNGECVGNEPPPADEEICGDGIDNNQNGIIDENCGVVQCEANADCPPAQACVNGLCMGNEPPPADEEICGDGIDNNQNGIVDENCDPVGFECRADDDCGPNAGCLNGQCVGNEPPPADEEICGDGIDNNGDGVVDENCDPVGFECQADDDCGPNAGCLNGQCVGNGPQPAEEICGDGIDNNQNGIVDENCDPVACGPAAGCEEGMACINGACVPDEPIECRANADCPAGWVCRNICVPQQ